MLLTVDAVVRLAVRDVPADAGADVHGVLEIVCPSRVGGLKQKHLVASSSAACRVARSLCEGRNKKKRKKEEDLMVDLAKYL